MKISITAADKSEEKLFYACDEEEIKAAKIGHMRFDFGSGRQFYGSWFSTTSELNDDEFRTEFNELTKELRQGLLKDRTEMGKLSERIRPWISAVEATVTRSRRTSIPTTCGVSRSPETTTVTASAMSVSHWNRQ